MVGHEPQPVRLRVITLQLILHHAVEGHRMTFTGSNGIHEVVVCPGVVHVKGALQEVGVVFILGKHQYRPDGIKLGGGPVPELLRHQSREVTPVTVDTDIFHPVFHGADHIVPQRLCRIVKLNHISPVEGRDEIAQGVFRIPLRVFSGQWIVPGRVVAYPVEYHVEAHGVSAVYKRPEVVNSAELGIDALVVADGVVASELTLPVHLADGIDGHEPENVHSQLLQLGQLLLYAGEGSLIGELPGVDLIKDHVAGPVGVYNGCLQRLYHCSRLWPACNRHGGYSDKQYYNPDNVFFHMILGLSFSVFTDPHDWQQSFVMHCGHDIDLPDIRLFQFNYHCTFWTYLK